ncbi:NUDIX hydrolase [Clostridium sp. OS1-26]|uniref:NUDIX hydrolase n=1 Tax=Clostridium sp. OS1-26 TaxID=3070681 RepID=UPI0027DFCD69|nr:NUDIX hydrolase [Clostridium sp. OS1-26]WML35742.1 NUDIX hydrolase [Clostridium sp. OS1-26]
MLKRDTRVQIFIVENGKYILLKHHDIKRDLYFWGVPGGGREIGETDEEAAIREAYEETGLKVKLLSIKIEGVPQIKTSMYNRVVTFLAYPTEGKAKLGYEPEPELKQYYRLVDIKWKDFYDDSDLERITYNEIVPFRNIIDSEKFIKKKEFFICKIVNKTKYCLLLYNEKNQQFELPSQKNQFISKYIRNLNNKLINNIGFFLSENDGILYKIDIIYIEISDSYDIDVECGGKWFKYDELYQMNLDRICQNIIEKVNKSV